MSDEKLPAPLPLIRSESVTGYDEIQACSIEAGLESAQRGADFTFSGNRYRARVVSAYDGDTVRVVFHYRGEMVQWQARMFGYESPEMKPKLNNPDRVKIKAAAAEAKKALMGKVENKTVDIVCGKFEKYGRVLITVYADGENINEWMLANNYGVPYSGGTKAKFRPCETSH